MPLRRPVAALAALALAVPTLACSSSSNAPPADVSGNYTISVTNGDNGCNYSAWTVGKSTSNLAFDVTENGGEASGNLKGVADFEFAVLGIGTLNGTVTGDHADLTAKGTTGLKQGNCAYFVDAEIAYDLSGNAINGTVTYTNSTNGDPSCGTLSTCTSTQTLSGNRPPQ